MKYFGTDGIRGVPNKKLTIDLLTKLGMALQGLDCKDVVLATDTRVSKDMLAYAISSGCLARGLNVHYVGVLPTPALIYLSYVKKITGVMITASHNPYTDNGIKVLKNGVKLTDEQEALVENLIDNPIEYDGEIGRFFDASYYRNEYFDFILKKIKPVNKKVLLDCANGATSVTAPYIFSKITNNLIITASNPDGYNINNGVGSTHLDFLQKNVVANGCDIGFAFDGDGDRVLCVDNTGRLIDGDMLMYILARHLKNQGKLNSNKVVFSIMSNLGLIGSLAKHGIGVHEAPVGDKYVVQALHDNNLSVGGENSGHIILPAELPTGDGVMVAALVMKLLSETDTQISDWLTDVHMYADKMINLKVEDKQKVLSNKALYARIEEIKKELNGDCKIIVRPSGTEELVRVTVMAKTQDLVDKYINELVNMVKEMF